MFNRDIRYEIYKHLRYNKPFLVSREDYILRNLMKTGEIEITPRGSVFTEDGSVKILYPRVSKVIFYIRNNDVEHFDNILLYMNRETKIVIIINDEEDELVYFPIECIQRLINHLGPKDNVTIICRGNVFFVYNKGYMEIYDTYIVEDICDRVKLDNENIFAVNVKSLLNDKTRVLMIGEDVGLDEDLNFDGVYGLSLSYRMCNLPEVSTSVRYLEYRNDSNILRKAKFEYISGIMGIFGTSRENFRMKFPNIETIVVPDFILPAPNNNIHFRKTKYAPKGDSKFQEVVLKLFRELINMFNNRVVTYTSNVIKREIKIIALKPAI